MDAITVLGTGRRACTGATRRETLKVGALSLLAFEMLTSAELRAAFDLDREDPRTRDRYGRTLFGSSTLLARRLVERGVRFVNVSWDNHSQRFGVSKAAWETHERNFPMLRETLLPNFDQTYAAFIADLDARGLLDETLVVTLGEMGRTPRINAKGGRDPWTYCYSVLFAGAGIRGGTIFGASDKQAGFIKEDPVHIRDICATISHLLGIDPAMPVYDRANRPIAVARGAPDRRDPGVRGREPGPSGERPGGIPPPPGPPIRLGLSDDASTRRRGPPGSDSRSPRD